MTFKAGYSNLNSALFNKNDSSSSSQLNPPPVSTPLETKIQNIGYHLTGKFDESSQFEMTLYPNNTKHTVRVIRLGVLEEKNVDPGNLPPGWSMQSVAKDFFTKNVTVTRFGASSMGVYSVKIALGRKNEALPVSVYVRVTGVVPGQLYQLDLTPSDLTISRASLKNSINGNMEPIDLDIYNLRHLTYLDFQDQLPRLEKNLKIELFKQPRQLRTTLNQINQESNQKTPSSASHKSSRSSLKQEENDIHNVREICRLMGPGSQDAKNIANDMVGNFNGSFSDFRQEMSEIEELLVKIVPYSGFDTVNILLRHVQDSDLTNEFTLKSLTGILVRMQQIYFLRTWEAADFAKYQASLSGVNKSHLSNLLKMLNSHLKNTNIDKIQNTILIEQIKATAAILHLLVETWKLGREDFVIDAYTSIKGFINHTNYQIAYHARNVAESFSLTRVDLQAPSEVLVHSALYFLQELAKHISNATKLRECVSSMASALKIQNRQGEWYLLAFRFIIFSRPEHFHNAVFNILHNQLPDVNADMNVQNPLFLMDIAELLWEVLYFPQVGSLIDDLDIKLFAIDFYSKIYDSNSGKMNNSEKYSTSVLNEEGYHLNKESYKKELESLIVQRLQACTTHPLLQVREAAKRVIRTHSLEEKLPEGVELFTLNRPSLSFNRAVRAHNPLLLALESMKETLLNDVQLADSTPYFISPEAKNSQTKKTCNIESHFSEFLAGNSRVLAIGGDGGAGKSLSVKMFAHGLLNSYQPEGYSPIYVSLPTLVDPAKAISQVLETHGIKNEKEEKELLNKKTVWILDAYDEIELPKNKGQLTDLNLFQSGDIAKLNSNAKIIFLYKSASQIKPDKAFLPLGGGLTEIIIQPFNDHRIFEYIDKFCHARERFGSSDPLKRLLWTKKQYADCFNELKNHLIWGVISNPLRLKIGMEFFPLIARGTSGPNSNIGDLFKDLEKEDIDERFFTHFACIRALRSARKLNPYLEIAPEKFILYQIKLADRMHKYRTRQISQNMSNEESDRFGDLFLNNDPTTGIPNSDFAKECLEVEVDANGQKKWKFMCEEYSTFLYTQQVLLSKESQTTPENFVKKLVEDSMTQKEFNSLYEKDL